MRRLWQRGLLSPVQLGARASLTPSSPRAVASSPRSSSAPRASPRASPVAAGGAVREARPHAFVDTPERAPAVPACVRVGVHARVGDRACVSLEIVYIDREQIIDRTLGLPSRRSSAMCPCAAHTRQRARASTHTHTHTHMRARVARARRSKRISVRKSLVEPSELQYERYTPGWLRLGIDGVAPRRAL